MNEQMIKLVELINSNRHFDFEVETYLDNFKKLEKFLQFELNKADSKE